MADSDLLRKLDALLMKHRASSASGGAEADADIPVLTDVVEAETPPSAENKAAPPAATVAAASALTDAEVETLSRDIYRRVMARLGDQISTDLRDHLTQRLSSIIDNTVSTAIEDFKQELANTVGDAIAEVLLDRAERLAATDEPPPV